METIGVVVVAILVMMEVCVVEVVLSASIIDRLMSGFKGVIESSYRLALFLPSGLV